MSNTACDAAVRMTAGDVTAKAVLMVVAEMASKAVWKCWASLGTIAERAECTEKTAREALRRLVARGCLVVDKPRGRTVYTIPRDPVAATAEPVAATDPEPVGATAQPVAPFVEPVAPTPPSEPPRTSKNLQALALVADAAEPRPKRAKPKRGRPDSDELGPGRLAYAVSEGMTEATAVQQWRQFLDHHEAKASAFASWDAAWRTWVRNWTGFGARQVGPRGQPQGRPTVSDRNRDATERALARLRGVPAPGAHIDTTAKEA